MSFNTQWNFFILTIIIILLFTAVKIVIVLTMGLDSGKFVTTSDRGCNGVRARHVLFTCRGAMKY